MKCLSWHLLKIHRGLLQVCREVNIEVDTIRLMTLCKLIFFEIYLRENVKVLI